MAARKPVTVPGYEEFSFYCERHPDPATPEKIIWRMREETTGLNVVWGETRPQCIRDAKTLFDLWGKHEWLRSWIKEKGGVPGGLFG